MGAYETFVVIPFDYEQLPYGERSSIVPICVQRRDQHGRPIAWGWFSQGAAPAASYIRTTAKRVGDEHLASELAEYTVHALWYRHHDKLGPSPHRAVMREARYRALDMIVGGERWMRSRTHKLIPLLRQLEGVLPDPENFLDRYTLKQELAILSERLIANGQHDVNMILEMIRDQRDWEEISQHLGRNTHTLKQTFRRWTRRLYP